MGTIEFTADEVVLEDPCGLTVCNSTDDWFALAFDESWEPAPDGDPTGRIYSEYFDQGNGGWGGIDACALTADRLVVSLSGERRAVLSIKLRLTSEAHATLRERLGAVFREAPDRLQLASM